MKKMLRYPHAKLGLSVLAVIVLLFGYYFYAMSTRVDAPIPTIEITSTDHTRGAQEAKVTLVEFGDLQCPACKAYEPIVRQLLAQNPDTLQLVFRHFPLTQIHQNALISAKATEAAALQGKFWEMHDVLYDRQTEWANKLNAREIILGFAQELALDVTKFTQDLESEAVEKKILAEYAEGLKLGVQGTPTFFINGQMIQSPRTVEEFDALIKAAAQTN